MPARFLQIHTLTSYPAALLNRDDAGFAKRLPFGGAVRTRISSQCLKRHWRMHEGAHALGELAPRSVRSRFTFQTRLCDRLVAGGAPQALAEAATAAVMSAVLGESPKAKASKEAGKKGKDEADLDLKTGQITVLGQPELDYLYGVAAQLVSEHSDPKKLDAALKERLGKEGRKNLEALRLASGLDAALFGRMVTSDILARGDAALHVAHAFTVHAEEAESDYFSAVDDLVASGEITEQGAGSGHIGSVELTSGLYYGYVVVDVPLLVSNLEGCDRRAWTSADRALAADVIERVVRLVATVSPGAKLGSTAPHAYASVVLVEAGDAQPRTLANAFLEPVRPRGDVLRAACDALQRHAGELDRAYGDVPARGLLAVGCGPALGALASGDRGDIGALATWAAAQVRGA